MSRHVTLSLAAETLLITDFCRIPDNPYQSYGQAAMFFDCCLGYEGIPDEEWIKPAEKQSTPRRATGVRFVGDTTALRLRVRKAGFDPIPARGKAPAISKWETKLRAEEDEICNWDRLSPPARNTGIIAQRTPAIDLDILNADAVVAAEKLITKKYSKLGRVLVRTGKAPKSLIIFRTDEPFKKITANLIAPDGSKGQKIELLADGQQFVAFGIHPDTREPYRWKGSEPGNVKWNELPPITAAEASALVDNVVAEIEKFGYRRGNEKPLSKDFAANWENIGGIYRRDWSVLVRKLLEGEEIHDTIRDMAASFVTSNMSPPAAIGIIKAIMLQSSAIRDKDSARWQERYDDIERAVQSAVNKFAPPALMAEPLKPGQKLFDPWAEYNVPDFPSKILSSELEDFANATAEQIGNDVATVAMSALTVMSGAVDHRSTLEMTRHTGWKVRPRVWTLLNGRSSMKKSPPMKAVAEPLREKQAELQALYRLELNAAGDENEKPHPPSRYIVNDTSIEKLGEILLRNDGRGTLIIREELSGWIGSMEKYAHGRGASSDRGFYLEAYDGGSYHVDRINRGELFIPNISLSILGGIQPKVLAELKGLTSDGLLQRFIPVVMTRSALAIDRPADTRAYKDLVWRLLDMKPRQLWLSGEGLEVMEDIRKHLHEIERNADGLWEGFDLFIGKLAGVSGSLALLLHLVADPAEARFVAVTSTTVERVKRLVTEFIIPHAMEFYRSVSAASPNGDHLRKLASWILTNSKQRIVASDITANVAGFRGLGLFDLNRRVSPLVAAGWLTPCDPKLGPVNKRGLSTLRCPNNSRSGDGPRRPKRLKSPAS